MIAQREIGDRHIESRRRIVREDAHVGDGRVDGIVEHPVETGDEVRYEPTVHAI